MKFSNIFIISKNKICFEYKGKPIAKLDSDMLAHLLLQRKK